MLKINSLKIVKKFDIDNVHGFVLYAINDEFFGVRVSDLCRIYGLSPDEIRYMNGFFGSKFCKGFGFYGLGDSVYVKYNLMENVFKSIEYYASFNSNYVKRISVIKSFFSLLDKEVKYWFLNERKENTRNGTHFSKPYVGGSRDNIIDAFKDYVSYEAKLKQQTEKSVRLLRGKNKILSEHVDSLNQTYDRLNKRCDNLKEVNDLLSKKLAAQSSIIENDLLSLREISEWKDRTHILKDKILNEGRYSKHKAIDSFIFTTMARKYNIDFTTKRKATMDNLVGNIKVTNYDLLLADKNLRDLYLEILEHMAE